MGMKYKLYPSEIWSHIHASIDKALLQNPRPIAAFDADGTLWDTDLGESFFRYKIDRNLVELPEDPWNHYFELKKKHGDPRTAYLWLAQILKGQKIDQVQTWAQESVKALAPVPVFEEQKKLIETFKSRGVQVYIVTASIKWAVEAGAALVGLTPDDVIGIETDVQDGVVTDRPQGIITHREGKAEALLHATGGKKPFFCSGNTMGDLELLECSTDLKLAVSAASRDDRIFRTEDDLQKLAMERGWLHHRFIVSE